MTTVSSDRVPGVNRAMVCVAAALVHLAGTAVALGQDRIQTMGMVQDAQPAKGAKAGKAAAQAKPAEHPDAKGGTRVKVDDNMLVDLHVADEDLSTVLEMLSIQSQKNIIASSSVNARITANLYGATFEEALDSILHVNGFGYTTQGNFVYVYTADEMKAIEAAQRQRVSKVLRLNYLNAVDAAAFVTPLLSEGGQIKTPNRTTQFPSISDIPVGSDEYVNDAMLVVFDYEENVTEVEALLKQIDTKPAQVLVEATVLQTQLTEANAFGVDFSLIADLDFKEFVGVGGPLTATNSLIGGRATPGGTTPFPGDGKGSALTSTVGNTSGPGGLKIGVVDKDVAVFMRVLDEVTDSTILSNPKILTLNRMASRVLVGRKVGYISTTSTDTATTQSVQFLDTGTQLYFRPFVTSDGLIRMELKPQVSEAVIRDVKDAAGAALTVPDEITNELITNVMVRDGQTIVLGGLFRESTQTSRSQIPLLGDIPLIGSAFRGHDDTVNRSEIIFLITPTIVNDTTLAEAGQRGLDHAENARAGARQGLLWFSRERLSSMLNVRAERLAGEGKTDAALWNLDASLHMNPTQPEAIDMRSKLSGKRPKWPSRSALDKIIGVESKKLAPRADAGEGNGQGEFQATSPAEGARAVSMASANGNATSESTGVANRSPQFNGSVTPTNTTSPVQPTETQVIASASNNPAYMENSNTPSTQSTPATFQPYSEQTLESLALWSNPDGASFSANEGFQAPANATTTAAISDQMGMTNGQNTNASLSSDQSNDFENVGFAPRWFGRGGLAGGFWAGFRGMHNQQPSQFTTAPTDTTTDATTDHK